jgi:soluble lytic murein transglycosylase-like protein
MKTTTPGRRRSILAAVVAFVALSPLGAHAELWGYIDGAGVAHLAQTQVDSRYHAVLDSGASTAQNVRGKSDDTGRLLIWLEIAPEVRALMPVLRAVAREQDVDVELLTAVVAVESGFKSHAISPRGAIGLMQLTPDAANRYASKTELQTPAAQRLLDPRTNVLTGARMLADLTQRFHSIDVALAAWNAGEGAVRRSGGKMPAIDETQAHVHQVLELYWALLQNPLARHATRLKMQSEVAGL